MTIEPVRILVTGFGGFPGARTNPTARLIHALGADEARLARFGVEIERHILPVVYAAVAPRLRDLAETFRPDAILHFGLAARRKHFSVETRAMNRLSAIRPDAAGATAAHRSIAPGADLIEKASFPASLVAAALRRAGIDARLSNNAGDYVCNQTFCLSLAARQARSIGFIHTPRLARRRAEERRPTLDDAKRVAFIALLVMAKELRQRPVSQPRDEALTPGGDPTSRHDNVTEGAEHLSIFDAAADDTKITPAGA